MPIEQLQDNKMLRSHSSNVMHSLTGVIGLLDDPEALVENLLKMGSNHNPRNISKQAFDVRPYKYIIPLKSNIFTVIKLRHRDHKCSDLISRNMQVTDLISRLYPNYI